MSGGKRMLDLGCGFKKRPGAIGVDENPLAPADIHHDLNVFPYPLADNAFDDIEVWNVLEHLEDVVRVMEEIHRIAAPGADVRISVPHFSGADYHTDPTHRRAFTSRSFDYFVTGTHLYEYRYSRTARFIKRACVIGGERPPAPWRNPLLWWINRHQDVYERRFAYLYPQMTVFFLLEAVK